MNLYRKHESAEKFWYVLLMLHKTWPLLKTKPEKASENKVENVICHDVKPLLCPQLEQCMQFWFLHLGKDTVKFKNLPKKANKITKEWGNHRKETGRAVRLGFGEEKPEQWDWGLQIHEVVVKFPVDCTFFFFFLVSSAECVV